MTTSSAAVQEILSQRSLAIVGVSRKREKFGNVIYRELKGKGYSVFAIHPQAETIEGDQCFASFQALPEKIGAVVICVPPAQCERVVQQAHEAGIMRVWMQQGAESYSAVRYCENHEMTVVHGECIMMFAEPVRSFHSFHRWVWKLIGRYPSAPAHRH